MTRPYADLQSTGSEYEVATPIRGFSRGVLPRVSSAGDELFVGIPFYFTPYNPPSRQRAETVRVGLGRRRVISWYDRNGNDTFDNWKLRFLVCIHSFWDKKFTLRRSGSQTGSGSSFPDVVARFYPYEVESEGESKARPLCFCAMTRDPNAEVYDHGVHSNPLSTGHQGSNCSFFGSSRITWGLPAGYQNGNYSMTLDSNDIRRMAKRLQLADGTVVPTWQAEACHELGHHLGLQHRCFSLPPESVPTNRNFHHPQRGDDPLLPDPAIFPDTYVHPTGSQDRTTRRLGRYPDYCEDSSDETAIRDLMAAGDELNPWHAAIWLEIMQHVQVGGRDYGSVVWTARVNR